MFNFFGFCFSNDGSTKYKPCLKSGLFKSLRVHRLQDDRRTIDTVFRLIRSIGSTRFIIDLFIVPTQPTLTDHRVAYHLDLPDLAVLTLPIERTSTDWRRNTCGWEYADVHSELRDGLTHKTRGRVYTQCRPIPFSSWTRALRSKTFHLKKHRFFDLCRRVNYYSIRLTSVTRELKKNKKFARETHKFENNGWP